MNVPRANPATVDPNEWECWLDEGHLWGVGHTTRTNPYDFDPTEAEAWALHEELLARDARRVPLGFRAETAASSPGAGAFPVVGHLTPKGA